MSGGVWEAGVHLVDAIILTKDAELFKNWWELCCLGQGLMAYKARSAFQSQLYEVLAVSEWNFNFVL